MHSKGQIGMRSKAGTLAVVCLATAMLMLDIAVVNTALPRVARDLNAGLGGLQWIIDAYTVALAAIVLTAGSVADRFGRRRVYATGFGVAAFGALVPGAAALGHGSATAYVDGLHSALFAGAALAALGAVASALLLGLRRPALADASGHGVAVELGEAA